MDIVIVPCYMRPEYLSLCLEYLSKAEGAHEGKEYWLCQDFRRDDESRYKMQMQWTREVIEKSPLPVRYIQRKPHNFAGNSYNTLEAYWEAYQTDARYVYLVEEDCLVTPDHFIWHEAIQQKEPDTMCSIAYRCSRNNEAKTDITDAGSYFTSSRDYASIGVCWKRERLAPIVAHAKFEYYDSPGHYLDSNFPEDIYSGWFHEQDGAAMRIMHREKAFTTWAYVPRVYHMGWYGYHRPSGRAPSGQLQIKIDAIREQLGDRERLKISAPDFGDIEPYDATLNVPFESLHKEQHFE